MQIMINIGGLVMKPLIGIAANLDVEPSFHLEQNVVGCHYIESVKKAGGLPVLIPFTLNQSDISSYVNLCQGFLFCGGGDINPLLFGENPHPLNGSGNLELDQYQLALMKKILSANKPVLGICRGIQILNVACGGTIYQDLSLSGKSPIKHKQLEAKRHFASHKVTFLANSILHDLFGSELFTNSYHHQSVNRLGENLVATGFTDDNFIESIEMLTHPFQVGVQWHPENFIQVSDVMLPLFQRLVDTSSKTKKENTSL